MNVLKILALTRYDTLGASSRVRLYQYLPYLAAHEVNVTVCPLLDNNYIKNLYSDKPKNYRQIANAYFQRMRDLYATKTYDLLWIEKEVFPSLPMLGNLLLKHAHIPYVIDYDDATFHNYDKARNTLKKILLQNKLKPLIKNAALVTVGNDYLANYANHSGAKRVELLPSVIDLDNYPVLNAKTNEDEFVIGWIGTPATKKYLSMLAPVLSELSKSIKLCFHVIGLNNFSIDGVKTKCIPWVESQESQQIANFNVGVMPLHDDAWERGKCGYKLIQYMAGAKPVIASPIGINKDIVIHGKNGYHATTLEEWKQAIMTLAADKHLQETMGKHGRQLVEKHYSLQVNAPKLHKLLSQIIDDQVCVG